MKPLLKNFFQKFKGTYAYLLLANIFLVALLILLSNLNILPIPDFGDFIFFLIIGLAFALYRPGWSFLFFIGTTALENINIAPKELGIAVRPYQFFGALTLLAVLIKLPSKKINFKLPRFGWNDLFVAIFIIAGFFSALGSSINKTASLKLSVIALSFAALYFLARIFIQNFEDLKKIIPIFLSSSLVVLIYGIWQNIRFAEGFYSFEVMPGRPNATFTEADWYGIFLAFLLAIIYSLIYFFNMESEKVSPKIPNFKFKISNLIQNSNFEIQFFFLHILLIISYISLILTVSRSAWLGAFAITFIFLLIILTDLKFDLKKWDWKYFWQTLRNLAIAGILSFGIIYLFNLTTFQLGNRVQSTASGLQQITVACKTDIALPQKIGDVSQLAPYGCQHINLQDIAKDETQGLFVKEIYRIDPNVNIRSVIYQRSWQEIKTHPVLGIGWGNISKILGKDEHGNGLNSSNIFLETWLGAGILGLIALVLFIFYIIIETIKHFRKNDGKEKSAGLFFLLGILALIIPNFFNAGIFLAILWAFFGITTI